MQHSNALEYCESTASGSIVKAHLTSAGLRTVCWYSKGSTEGRLSTIRPGLLCAAVLSSCTAALRTCLHHTTRSSSMLQAVQTVKTISVH